MKNTNQNRSTSYGIISPLGTSTQSATRSKGNQTSDNIANEVKILNEITKYLLIGIVTAILVLGIDLFRDSSLHSRMTELERSNANFRAELSRNLSNFPDNSKFRTLENITNENQEILSCLKIRRYFDIINCFN